MKRFSFTIMRYDFRQWSTFRGSRRCGVNLGRLAFRVSWGRH